MCIVRYVYMKRMKKILITMNVKIFRRNFLFVYRILCVNWSNAFFFRFFPLENEIWRSSPKKKLIIEYYWLNFNETSHFPFYLRHTFCLFQTVKVIIIIKLLLKQLDKSIFMLFTSLLPKKGYAVIHIPITSISIDSKFGMLYCSIR